MRDGGGGYDVSGTRGVENEKLFSEDKEDNKCIACHSAISRLITFWIQSTFRVLRVHFVEGKKKIQPFNSICFD